MTYPEYFRPSTLAEAADLLERYGHLARVLAGGTDLIVNMRDKALVCRYLIDIKGIPEMQELSYTTEQGLIIGGAVTVNRLLAFPEVNTHYPLLVQAGKTLAHTLVRNRATLLGNLCNASPAADLAPAALVLGAAIEVFSLKGTRQIPLSRFFLGVKRNALNPGELAVRVIIPPSEGKGVYLKKSRVKGHDLAQVGVAGFLSAGGELRLALGAVAPTPLCISGLEAVEGRDLLEERNIAVVLAKITEQVNPITDQRASKEYRLAMAKYLTRQVLAALGKEVRA